MTEDWAQKILDQMHYQRHEKKPTGKAPDPSSFYKDNHRTHVIMGKHLDHLLLEAARKRNVSKSAYVRRAVAILLAKDLGGNVRSILSKAPACRPMNHAAYYGGETDDAHGIETWCPHPGCDGQHLIR